MGVGAGRAMPVRIVHTITKLELGGAQQNTLYTLSNLPEGFSGYLVCGEGGYLDKSAEEPGKKYDIRFCPYLKREINPVNDFKAYRWMVSYFREIKPDIVHSHSSKAGIISRWAAKKAGVPVIIHTFHGFGFTPLQPWFIRKFFIWLEKITAKISTKLITVAHANIEKALDNGIGEREQYVVVRSGIDLEAYKDAQSRRGTDSSDKSFFGFGPEIRKVVGNISCFKPQKGLRDFVDACGRLAAINKNIGFVLVGDGRQRRELEERAAARGLKDNFRMLGWRSDMADIICGFDVMLHTAYFEGLPRVFLEAMACGVPIVATDVDGAEDVITHGENGYLVRTGDISAMVDFTYIILQDDTIMRKMSLSGREKLGPEFSIKVMSETLNRLYDDMVKGKVK